MSWHIFIILSIVSSTAYTLIGKFAAQESSDARTYSVIYDSIATLIAISFFFFDPPKIYSLSSDVLIFMGLSIVSLAFFERTQFIVRKKFSPSRVALFYRLTPVVTIVASVLLLGESVTPLHIFGVILIMGGNLLLFTKKFGRISNRSMILAICSALMLGLAWTADKRASAGFSASLYTVLLWLIPMSINIIIPPINIKNLKHEMKHVSFLLPLLALCNVCAYYFFIKALAYAPVSIIAPLESISTVLVVIFAILFLGERNNLGQKLTATALVMVGTIMLGVLSN